MRDESDNPTTQMSGQDDTFQMGVGLLLQGKCFAAKTRLRLELKYGDKSYGSDLPLKLSGLHHSID